jgi:hypothetical protein
MVAMACFDHEFCLEGIGYDFVYGFQVSTCFMLVECLPQIFKRNILFKIFEYVYNGKLTNSWSTPNLIHTLRKECNCIEKIDTVKTL